MPNLLVWYVGDRNPSITETITVDGEPFDLSASTVTFNMREVGTDTLTIDAASATIVTAPSGSVRYDWASGDVDTAGTYLIWWEVTTSGKIQSVSEAVIAIRDHAPLSNTYVELERLKKRQNLDATTFADLDIEAAILAATSMVNKRCNRQFTKDTVDSTRYYTPQRLDWVAIDDLADATSVKLDLDADGTYETTLTENTDFVFEPLNAETDGWPRTAIRIIGRSGRYLPLEPRSVQVVGKHGWDAVPYEVVSATELRAARLLKRRETPYGLDNSVGFDGATVRIPRFDSDEEALLAPFVRLTV